MTSALLDREELRRLFDLRNSYNAHVGGLYTDDPYPIWRELRERAPVHEGIVHELMGYEGAAFFHGLPYPDRPHFSAFSFDACDSAYRDPEVFASSPDAAGPAEGEISITNSMSVLPGWPRSAARLVSPSNWPPNPV